MRCASRERHSARGGRQRASEELERITAVPAFAGVELVDVRAFAQGAVETDGVAQAVPRLGTDKGGVLSLGCPEEPDGRIALDAGQAAAAGTEDVGSGELSSVKDQGLVGKSVATEGNAKRSAAVQPCRVARSREWGLPSRVM